MSEILGVYALKYAESTIPESWVFRGGDANVKIPISFTVYLIETDDRRILVDAGCDTMPGFDMKYFVSPVEILARLGYSPDDITDVIDSAEGHGIAVFQCNSLVIGSCNPCFTIKTVL